MVKPVPERHTSQPAPAPLERADRSSVAELRLRGAAGTIAARVTWLPRSEPGAAAVLVVFAGGPLDERELAGLLDGAYRSSAAVIVCVPVDEGRGARELSVEDAYRVMSWLAAHAEELDARPGPIVVGADGPAATLAGAACERARVAGWPPVAACRVLAPAPTHSPNHQPDRKEIPMRKVKAALFITADGVTDHPEQWQGPYMSPEVGEAMAAAMATADTILLGRRTYEEWAAFWPHQGPENPFAAKFNTTRKLVASTTLGSPLDWANSERIEGDVAETLTGLKQQDGKDILINGSATLVRSLLGARVLDELALLIHPVVVGDGRRLFDGAGPAALELLESTTFPTGVVSTTYRPARA